MNRRTVLVAIVVTLVLSGCGKSNISWTEEVQINSGEIFTVKRTAKTKDFGQIGGTGGWENEGMSVEIITPIRPGYPGPWNAKFVPLVFDRDPETNEWFMVATFYSCTSWYDLGRPKLPYTEFRFKNGQWVQQALSEEFIGREANMLTNIRSSGEPDHTLASKRQGMSDTRIAPKYLNVVSSWQTNC